MIRRFFSFSTALFFFTAACIQILFESSEKRMNQILAKCCARIIKVLHVHIQIEGDYQKEPRQRTIIMSNHTSAFDIIVLFHIFQGSVRMAAKKSLFDIPLLGRAMRKMGCIEVDRGKPQLAVESLTRKLDSMSLETPLWIAPEGTYSKDGKMLPLKRGGAWLALKSQALVVPLIITGTNSVLPNGKFLPRLSQKVRIRFGATIDTRIYESSQSKELLHTITDVFMKMQE